MIVPIYQKLVERTDNRPMVVFPGGFADYITVHMTGNRNAGANAKSHADWMYNTAPYSWHVTVDDREAWQSINWTMQGWHAGDDDGTGNRESIGLEICMNSDIDQERAYDNAAWVAAKLRHAGHGKVGLRQHNFWTGKNCPELIRAIPGRWSKFLIQEQTHFQSLRTDLEVQPMTPAERQELTKATLNVAQLTRDRDALRVEVQQLRNQIWGENAPKRSPVVGYITDADGNLVIVSHVANHLKNHPGGATAIPEHVHESGKVQR